MNFPGRGPGGGRSKVNGVAVVSYSELGTEAFRTVNADLQPAAPARKAVEKRWTLTDDC